MSACKNTRMFPFAPQNTDTDTATTVAALKPVDKQGRTDVCTVARCVMRSVVLSIRAHSLAAARLVSSLSMNSALFQLAFLIPCRITSTQSTYALSRLFSYVQYIRLSRSIATANSLIRSTYVRTTRSTTIRTSTRSF